MSQHFTVTTDADTKASNTAAVTLLLYKRGCREINELVCRMWNILYRGLELVGQTTHTRSRCNICTLLVSMLMTEIGLDTVVSIEKSAEGEWVIYVDIIHDEELVEW